MRRLLGPALVAGLLSVLGLLVTLGLLTPSGANAAGPRFRDAAGIHVVSVRRIDDRQYDVSVVSAALGRPVDVRVLVPVAYARDTRRYPALYLFHGTSGRASDWVNYGDAEATTARLPLIVVMPDAGFDGDGGGWFTDWYDSKTALGPSRWETFHVRQLIPWVDRNLRTVAQRRGRAIAGLSQGGFGSMSYAARHPDMFVSAASFSGAPDIDRDPVVAAGATAVIQGTAAGLDRVERDAMFGPRSTNEINWQGHNPAQLAENLRATDMWLYTANGLPGPLDPLVPNPSATAIEALTHTSTLSFHRSLVQLGITDHLVDYGRGTHTFPYWARDLRWYVIPLMQTFAHPPAPPGTISYESIDRRWSQWGWSVAVRRPAAQEFSTLSQAGRTGFMLRGTGTADVRTPRFYRPRSRAKVTLTSSLGRRTVRLRSDSRGRLRLIVALGAPGAPVTASVSIRVPGR